MSARSVVNMDSVAQESEMFSRSWRVASYINRSKQYLTVKEHFGQVSELLAQDQKSPILSPLTDQFRWKCVRDTCAKCKILYRRYLLFKSLKLVEVGHHAFCCCVSEQLTFGLWWHFSVDEHTGLHGKLSLVNSMWSWLISLDP